MINKVILMGRITQELVLKQTQSGISVLQFSIAVERNYARQGEERQADFITCIAWRQNAEFINRYFGKGRMIALEGNLRTRTYDDKNGTKHYVTEVYVESSSFTGEPKRRQNNGGYQQNKNTQNQPPPQQKPQQYPQADEQISIGSLDDYQDIPNDGMPL